MWGRCVVESDLLTLETGNDTGSNAKLLIRLCCSGEVCKPLDILLISSLGAGLISCSGIDSSVAAVEVVWRLCTGSISWFLDANRTAGCSVDSSAAAGARKDRSPDDLGQFDLHWN